MNRKGIISTKGVTGEMGGWGPVSVWRDPNLAMKTDPRSGRKFPGAKRGLWSGSMKKKHFT